MKFLIPLRLALFALLAVLATARSVAETSLKLKSEPGDYVGAGKTFSYPASAGIFSVAKNYADGVSVYFAGPAYADRWDLDFTAPGRVLLQSGAYPGATRYPFDGEGDPGLAIAGNGRTPGNVSGGFVVKEIAYGANGSVERFWAVFEQHSDGAAAALTGEIRYNVTVGPQVAAPLVQVATFDQDLDIPITATDSGGRLVTLTATNLPPGAVFTDHGDNTGTLHWRPSLSDSGALFTVTFSADNGAGGTDFTATAIEVRGITRLTMTSGPDDPVGGGLSYDFGLGDGAFSASLLRAGYGGGIAVGFNKPNYAGSWNLRLVPPPGEPLATGAYPASGWNPGRVEVTRDSFTAQTRVGSFQVKEIVIEGQKVRRFWATFEQYTAGATTPLRGEIRFNASTTFDLTAPVSAAVAAGGVVAVQVAAAGGAGGSFALSATNLPAGAIFTDQGNNTGTLRWPTALGDIGVHRVTFHAEDAGGQVREATTLIEVKGVSSLAIRRSAYGPYQPEQNLSFSELDGGFRLMKNEGDGISIAFTPNDGSMLGWDLDFAAPGKARLTPGLYRGATATLPADGAPTLRVLSRGQYLAGVVGTFEVKEIAYGPGETLTRFRATFAQDASAAGHLQGEVRFNATNVVTISAPLEQAATFGGPCDFEVTASSPAGGALVLSAANLPSGAVFTDRGDGTGHFHWATGVGDRGSRSVIFKAETSAGASDRATTAIDVTGVMALAMSSQSGDPAGQGKEYRLGTGEGRFTAQTNDRHGVTISFDAKDPSQSWNLWFAAPGNAPLAAGDYPGARPFYTSSPDAPGLRVRGSGSGYFYDITGSFAIKEIVQRPDGSIESFWATFVQRAEGGSAALAGEIKFNVAAPVQISVPPLATVPYGSARDLTVSALSIAGGRVTLSAEHLPPGATFTDHGDGTGTLHWQPGFAQIGDYAIVVTATNATGETATSTIAIEVAGITSLNIASDPGDDVGAGKTYDYPAAAGRFTARKYGETGVAVSVWDGTDSWYLIVQPERGKTLVPGIYPGAGSLNGRGPGISVSGGHAQAWAQTGAFRIRQLVYGPGDTIASFWAVFEQHNQDADAALVGEIKYNATAPDGLSILAPFQTRIRYPATIEFDIAARDPAGGAIGLGVVDGPTAALFTDHGDGTGTFRWTPGPADRGLWNLAFTARNAAGDTDSTPTSIKVLGVNSLTMESEYGDRIGAGRSYSFPADAGTFTAVQTYSNVVTVAFNTKGGKESWSLDFVAPRGARLQPGTYSGATQYPYQGYTNPGLDIEGNGRRSYRLTGDFTVKQIEYAADGTIDSFWVVFEQHADGATAALRGELKYNASPDGAILAPVARAVTRGQTLEFAVSANLPSGGSVALSAAGLPPGAVFIDHRDNTGTFRWPTLATQIGRYEVTFSAANARGPVDVVTTAIDVRGMTSLAMKGEAGESIGQGKSYYFVDSAEAFTIQKNDRNGVSIRFASDDGLSHWSLDFCAARSALLQPGTYAGATRFPLYQTASEPGIEVRGDGRSPYLVAGQFTVKQIVYGPDDSVTSFWATFEQHSGGEEPGLRGEIKFNATAPDGPAIPGSGVFGWQEVKGAFRGVTGNLASSLLAACGPVALNISNTGAVTGKVRLGNRTYFFKGAMSAGGFATLLAKSPDGRSVTVKLQVVGSGDRFHVAGTVLDAGRNLTAFTAGRVLPFHTDDALAGQYTFVLRPASGDLVAEGGWGSIVVGKTGTLRMVGTTADGRNFVTTALPNEEGSWPLFLETFFLRGSLSGLLTAGDLAASDIGGTLRWFRPPTAQGPYHAAASAELILEAARYRPASPALQLPYGYATLTVTGDGLTAFAERVALDGNPSRVTVFGANPARLSLYANGRTGQIRGTFRNAAKRVTTLRGIIYQKTNRGQGTFSDGIELGSFTLVPE